MSTPRLVRLFLPAVLAVLPITLLAQYTSPNVITTAGDVVTTLGTTLFVNHGLVGVGRISASEKDSFGETFGSVSGLQVTGWHRNGDGSYGGTFNILPDRGYNAGNFFSDYAARINTVGFTFRPYTGADVLPGATIAEKIAAQNQIVFSNPVAGVKFKYDDPFWGPNTVTTGLDPDANFSTLFGLTVPYVGTFSGPKSPSSDCTAAPTDCATRTINKLALDSEALVLKSDGSGYIGDEYGGFIYYFDAGKKIVGVIAPPEAFVPHRASHPPNTPYFGAGLAPATPNVNGRRINQGMEGVALSPDGTRLFALLQSATLQDSDNSQQNRRQTRLLVYDVSANPTPAAPLSEYALTLPTFRLNGGGGAATGLNRTAAQSEVVALDNARLLVLSRDGNGLGNVDPNPSVFKSVLLVDLGVGAPTDITRLSPSRDDEAGKITVAPGTLDPAITPLQTTEAVNMLNSTQLNKFHVEFDASGLTASPYQVSKLTLGEKWEGLALVPANDPDRPNDYFLFVGNDDDFLTSNGVIQGPDGLVSYNGFTGYAANRLPAPVDSTANENDTLFLAYRVTIISGSDSPLTDATPPVVTPHVEGTLGRNGVYTSDVTVTWTVADPESGVLSKSGCSQTTLTSDTPRTTLTCSATNGASLTQSASVTITITKPTPDGRMFGVGHVDQDGRRNFFAFAVSEIKDRDSAQMELTVADLRGRPIAQFKATTIDSVVFADDPAFDPGKSWFFRPPTTDTAKFAGSGRWNGKAGYTFDAVATDKGEPGRGRDTFAVVVKDPQGNVVANINDAIDGGNIQSTRLLLFWNW